MTDPETRKFTRIEAAAYLTDKGRKMRPQTLAGYVAKKQGPEFEKDGSTVRYTQDALDTWLAKIVKPKKANGHSSTGRERATTVISEGPRVNLLAAMIIEDFLTTANQVSRGAKTFEDGVRYANGLQNLRDLVSGAQPSQKRPRR